MADRVAGGRVTVCKSWLAPAASSTRLTDVLRDERDSILRLIAAAAAAVAALRSRLAGGGSPDDVVRDAQAAQGELLGKDAQLFRMLDPGSAAHALGDPARLREWAELLRVEAEAHRIAGRESQAAMLEERAEVLSRPK